MGRTKSWMLAWIWAPVNQRSGRPASSPIGQSPSKPHTVNRLGTISLAEHPGLRRSGVCRFTISGRTTPSAAGCCPNVLRGGIRGEVRTRPTVWWRKWLGSAGHIRSLHRSAVYGYTRYWTHFFLSVFMSVLEIFSRAQKTAADDRLRLNPILPLTFRFFSFYVGFVHDFLVRHTDHFSRSSDRLDAFGMGLPPHTAGWSRPSPMSLPGTWRNRNGPVTVRGLLFWDQFVPRRYDGWSISGIVVDPCGMERQTAVDQS